MNSVDIAVFTTLFLSVLVGFVRGGLSSILSTSGWIIAIIGNHYLFNSIESFLEVRLQSKLLTFVVGYVGGLFMLLFLVSIVNFLILSMLSNFRGGMIDKTIGVIFGGLRGILIVAVLFLCFETSMKSLSGEDGKINDYPEVLLDASTLPLMKKFEMQLLEYIPDNFKGSLSFKGIGEEKVSDITILNLLRKLSEGIPKDALNAINDSVEKNSQYMSERQILITKVKSLWEYRQNHKMSNLSKEDMKQIKSIIG
jgi:membrane protein required for colicin V production